MLSLPRGLSIWTKERDFGFQRTEPLDPLKVRTHRRNLALPQVHTTIDRWSRDVYERFFILCAEHKETKTKIKTKIKKERKSRDK
jgi:hypothetical protein